MPPLFLLQQITRWRKTFRVMWLRRAAPGMCADIFGDFGGKSWQLVLVGLFLPRIDLVIWNRHLNQTNNSFCIALRTKWTNLETYLRCCFWQYYIETMTWFLIFLLSYHVTLFSINYDIFSIFWIRNYIFNTGWLNKWFLVILPSNLKGSLLEEMAISEPIGYHNEKRENKRAQHKITRHI